jgi:hypothetical protein
LAVQERAGAIDASASALRHEFVRRLGTRERGANGLARHADERVKAVGEGDSKAGRTVTVQRRKLCAEIAHKERRSRPLSVAIGIV